MKNRYNLAEIREKGIALNDMYGITVSEEIYKFVTMKIGQIKSGEMDEVIDAYMTKREKMITAIKASLKKQFQITDETAFPQIYAFDLTAFKENDWGVTHFDPHPPYRIPYFDLLPEPLLYTLGMLSPLETMGHIVGCEVDLLNSHGCKRHFRCSRLSPTHIVGAVWEEVDPEILEMTEAPDIMEKVKEIGNPYQLFHYCLHRWPELKDTFLRDFKLHRLPLQLKELVLNQNEGSSTGHDGGSIISGEKQ